MHSLPHRDVRADPASPVATPFPSLPSSPARPDPTRAASSATARRRGITSCRQSGVQCRRARTRTRLKRAAGCVVSSSQRRCTARAVHPACPSHPADPLSLSCGSLAIVLQRAVKLLLARPSPPVSLSEPLLLRLSFAYPGLTHLAAFPSRFPTTIRPVPSSTRAVPRRCLGSDTRYPGPPSSPRTRRAAAVADRARGAASSLSPSPPSSPDTVPRSWVRSRVPRRAAAPSPMQNPHPSIPRHSLIVPVVVSWVLALFLFLVPAVVHLGTSSPCTRG